MVMRLKYLLEVFEVKHRFSYSPGGTIPELHFQPVELKVGGKVFLLHCFPLRANGGHSSARPMPRDGVDVDWVRVGLAAVPLLRP